MEALGELQKYAPKRFQKKITLLISDYNSIHSDSIEGTLDTNEERRSLNDLKGRILKLSDQIDRKLGNVDPSLTPTP